MRGGGGGGGGRRPFLVLRVSLLLHELAMKKYNLVPRLIMNNNNNNNNNNNSSKNVGCKDKGYSSGSGSIGINDNLRAIEVGIPVGLIQRCALLGSARILRKVLER